MKTLEVARHSPFLHEMLGSPEDDDGMMALNYLMHTVERYIQEPKRRRRPDSQSDEKKA